MVADTNADAVIVSERLELRSMTPAFYEAVIVGDLFRAETLLDVRIPVEWPSEVDRLARFWLGALQVDPERGPWMARAIVQRDDREMVGHIGFHDKPGAAYLEPRSPGGVEIGYTVFEAYRRHGYATEAAAALMDWAHRRYGITRFVASISPTNVASLGVIANFGFVRIGEHIDEEDGLETIFERRLDQ
jgi:ribosomal-protein-alanine N-acetyltransferase